MTPETTGVTIPVGTFWFAVLDKGAQVSEFESKLLRLISLGIVTLGSVGLCLVHPLAAAVFVWPALICMGMIVGKPLMAATKELWAWLTSLARARLDALESQSVSRSEKRSSAVSA